MKTAHLLYVTVLAPILVVAANAQFFSFNVSFDRDGTRVQMKFEEIERTDAISVVQASGVTPGTNVYWFYLVSGMCGLAKERGQSYFQAKEVQAEPLTLEVVFPKHAPVSAEPPPSPMAPNIYSVSQCPARTFVPDNRRVRPVQSQAQ